MKHLSKYVVCILLLSGMLSMPQPASAETIRCESVNTQYTECGRFVLTAQLIRRISAELCRENRTFGLIEGVLWVDQGCRADFDVEYFRKLAVAVNGNGNGRILSQPGGINCDSFSREREPDSCFELYPLNRDIILTAQPEPGSMFKGWAGACRGTADCRLGMNSNQYVTAKFKDISGIFPVISDILFDP